jgi:hypothetical protein
MIGARLATLRVIRKKPLISGFFMSPVASDNFLPS